MLYNAQFQLKTEMIVAAIASRRDEIEAELAALTATVAADPTTPLVGTEEFTKWAGEMQSTAWKTQRLVNEMKAFNLALEALSLHEGETVSVGFYELQTLGLISRDEEDAEDQPF